MEADRIILNCISYSTWYELKSSRKGNGTNARFREHVHHNLIRNSLRQERVCVCRISTCRDGLWPILPFLCDGTVSWLSGFPTFRRRWQPCSWKWIIQTFRNVGKPEQPKQRAFAQEGKQGCQNEHMLMTFSKIRRLKPYTLHFVVFPTKESAHPCFIVNPYLPIIWPLKLALGFRTRSTKRQHDIQCCGSKPWETRLPTVKNTPL